MLAGEASYDLIFCRNLLIYLTESSRSRVVSVLDRLLATDGVLVIGHADRLTPSDTEPRFIAVGERGAFAYRRVKSLPGPGQSSMLALPMPGWQAPVREKPGLQEPPIAKRRSAGWLPERTIPPTISSTEDVGSLLDRVTELVNRGQNEEAIAACEQHLRLQSPSAAVYYVLGAVHQSRGDQTRGEECLHKAVYLDPGHDEALLALALCAERRGDAAASATYRPPGRAGQDKKGVAVK